ncbi:MAG: outer membrane protein assembly factor BamA [Verrucomicrobiota bacterium]|jgi:outer membrane protein insertion porin family
MKSIIKPLGVSLVLGCATVALAQSTGPKIDRVDVKFVGPASVSEDFIRANIRLKPGANYQPLMTQDDVHSLYTTGQFYNIRVQVEQADDGGVVLTYIVQVRPRITEIRFEGNKKLKDSKLKKKVTFKVGEPLDEQKVFTDVQEIKKLYEKNGLADTKVKYVLNIEELTGHGIVIFHIEESPKVKIKDVEFIGATSFTGKKLRHELKVRRRWAFSWLTGSGYFEQDDFDGDRDRLTDFYRDHGFLDVEIKDVKLDRPTTNSLFIKYYVDEGRKYKVGNIELSGSKIFTDPEILKGLRGIHDYEHLKSKLGIHGLPMDTGDTFTPDGLKADTDLIEDFYGSKGYVDLSSEGRALNVVRIANVETGTMDLKYILGDSEKTYVQKVEIRGNLKTKDKVIRRELAISPGDVFNMVNVKISKKRLEGLDFFDKVDTRSEPIDPPTPGEKDLVINVSEKNTGNFTVGAGFSSVDSLVGYAEVSQENFDLFHPPYFTGGGEKIRLRIDLGLVYQNYELSFVEPWFLNRKLSLGVDLYRRELDFESPNNIYDETRTGAKISLTRALGSDFLIGSLSYNPEDVGISLNSGWHNANPNIITTNGTPQTRNVPNAILNQVGDQFFNRFGGSLAYDTRNSVQLPNHGQRTEISGEFSAGDESFYKLELTTEWYFPGFFKGHVLEIGGRTGVADSVGGGDVPFYDRYYLGGLYSLRGFQYRNVAPREPYSSSAPGVPTEPIGGDTYWFGSIEYSIPIFEQEGGVGLRFALFYDVGEVDGGPYTLSGDIDDNWGVGLRLNIPHLGPLRLDYGIPITTDKYNGSSGQFQFGVGWSRPF